MDLAMQPSTAQDIADEVQRARTKLPLNKHNLAALVEEVGELSQALIDHDFAQGTHPSRLQTLTHDVYKEAIQVACMAIRVAEEGDSSFPYAGTKGAYHV